MSSSDSSTALESDIESETDISLSYLASSIYEEPEATGSFDLDLSSSILMEDTHQDNTSQNDSLPTPSSSNSSNSMSIFRESLGGNVSFNTNQDNTSQNESFPLPSSNNSSISTSTGASGCDDSILQESLDGNVSAEVERIRRFCENVENNLASIGLGSVSTPRIIRGNRPRNTTAEPVEIIDLSSSDYSRQRRDATNRAPDAVIDLCTPVGSRQQPSSSTNTPIRLTGQRRRLEDSDPVIIESPSPPKRSYESANDSQQDNSYKCPVCLEPVKQRNPTTTKCGHIFCQICIESAIRSTHKCPMCNNKLTARQVFRVYL